MAIPFDPAEIVRTLGEEIARDTRNVAAAFLEDVVPRTPVDTGHARRNWQVNIGSPNRQELPGVDKSGSSTIRNGKARLKATRGRNPFVPVIVENNVPYIGRLNDGSSKQAPARFVEASLAKALRVGPRRKEI